MPGTEGSREGCGITVIDENLFVIGGVENDGISVKNEAFNSRTKQWKLKSPLQKPRKWVHGSK